MRNCPRAFLPLDRDLGRSDESEFNPVAVRLQYFDPDAIADDQFFATFAAEKQHLFPFHSTEFFDFAGYDVVPRSLI